MDPKNQILNQQTSPNLVSENAGSMGPETLEYNNGRQKTLSQHYTQSLRQGASQGSQSSPRLRSARKISTLNINNQGEGGEYMQRETFENLNSVIQEIEIDDQNEKNNNDMILPIKTLERKSSI